jgi:hypothetical protein
MSSVIVPTSLGQTLCVRMTVLEVGLEVNPEKTKYMLMSR